MLMSHLNKVTGDIKKGVNTMKYKQLTDAGMKDYEQSLANLLHFASREWNKIMHDSDRVNDRADKIEKHLMARERS